MPPPLLSWQAAGRQRPSPPSLPSFPPPSTLLRCSPCRRGPSRHKRGPCVHHGCPCRRRRCGWRGRSGGGAWCSPTSSLCCLLRCHRRPSRGRRCRSRARARPSLCGPGVASPYSGRGRGGRPAAGRTGLRPDCPCSGHSRRCRLPSGLGGSHLCPRPLLLWTWVLARCWPQGPLLLSRDAHTSSVRMHILPLPRTLLLPRPLPRALLPRAPRLRTPPPLP